MHRVYDRHGGRATGFCIDPKVYHNAKVSIDIVPLDWGCELTLVHELHPDWADYADRTKAGWTKMTGVLAGLLD